MFPWHANHSLLGLLGFCQHGFVHVYNQKTQTQTPDTDCVRTPHNSRELLDCATLCGNILRPLLIVMAVFQCHTLPPDAQQQPLHRDYG